MFSNPGALCSAPPPRIQRSVTPQQFHFGEFKLDRSRYQLERGDRILRLEKLPMELLILLLQRGGELVSREEIAEQLWGKDVFVDVDHSINTAVRKVRMVLRDDPERPRYVETVVGKGYRFAAPVTSNNGALEAMTTTGEQPTEANGSSAQAAPPAFSQSNRVRLRKKKISMFALAAMSVVLAAAGWAWLGAAEYFWRNPITDARFERVTDFEASATAAAISRDGHLVAFLSDRDGRTDVWVTQVGSGQFHNLTKSSGRELVNPLLRTLAFTPDGDSVLFWVRGAGTNGANIDIWSVPTLGGEPRPYLEGAAELDWSHDQSRLAYHTPGPGDPLFVSRGIPASAPQPIFTASSGMHSHFPIWSPGDEYIYFVHGVVPDKLDIWRIKPDGRNRERITFHNGIVSYPAFLGQRTLIYLATDADGSGPWLYGMDVKRRTPHRLSAGLDRYTSLAAAQDGRRLVLTLSTPKRSLWQSRIADSGEVSAPVPVSITTSTGYSPRLGPKYLLYVSSTGTDESIWKLTGNESTELWKAAGAQVLGAPAISRGGQRIAFCARVNGKARLYAMSADGSQLRVLGDSLELQGSPSWTADGRAIISAAASRGVTRLFRVPIDESVPVAITSEYSTDPESSPDGSTLIYSGPDVGTSFALKAVDMRGTLQPLPSITLPRGSRHFAFVSDGRSILVLRGGIQHKDLWEINLSDGAQKRLTSFEPGFDVRDFDVSPDGRELIFEREQEHSDVVLLELKR